SFFANRMDCRVKPGNDDCDYLSRCPSPGSRRQRSPSSPRSIGERVEIEFAARAESISHERALLRCVSCFTLRPVDAFYRGDVTERSVMAVGGRLPPPLLGVSSLDLAPLAFSRRGLFPCAVSDRDSSRRARA